MQRLQLNENSSVLPNGKTKSLSNETCLHSATNTKSSIPLFCYAVIAILNVFQMNQVFYITIFGFYVKRIWRRFALLYSRANSGIVIYAIARLIIKLYSKNYYFVCLAV